MDCTDGGMHSKLTGTRLTKEVTELLSGDACPTPPAQPDCQHSQTRSPVMTRLLTSVHCHSLRAQLPATPPSVNDRQDVGTMMPLSQCIAVWMILIGKHGGLYTCATPQSIDFTRFQSGRILDVEYKHYDSSTNQSICRQMKNTQSNPKTKWSHLMPTCTFLIYPPIIQ